MRTGYYSPGCHVEFCKRVRRASNPLLGQSRSRPIPFRTHRSRLSRASSAGRSIPFMFRNAQHASERKLRRETDQCLSARSKVRAGPQYTTWRRLQGRDDDESTKNNLSFCERIQHQTRGLALLFQRCSEHTEVMR